MNNIFIPARDVWRMALAACIAIAISAASSFTATAAEPLVVFSADTEGHLTPCQTCPAHAGQGGMARRATALAQLRNDGPILLVDAGNALYGTDSAATRGKVIVAAYDALGYDVVNLSFRDFRYGKAATLEVIKSAKFAVVSANVIDDSTGQPIVEPMAVRTIGAKKFAVVGVTEPPPGLEMIPHLKTQLAGLRFRPLAEALKEWIPKATDKADGVFVLYYGSPAGLKIVREACGESVAGILVGGLSADRAPAADTANIGGCEEHGKSLGVASPSGKTLAITQMPIDPSIQPDVAIEKLLATFAPPKPLAAIAATPAAPPLDKKLPSPTTVAAIAQSRPIDPVKPPTTPPTSATPPPVAQAGPAPAASASPAPTRITAHQPLTPKGLAGVGLTSEQVNAAIDRARTFLWEYLQAEHAKHHVTKLVDDGPDLLSALALVHADAHHKIPEFNAQLRQYLAEFNPRVKQLSTYECGLFCLLVEAYGDPVFLPKLRDTARYLVELQGPLGTWNYGVSLPPSIYGEVRHDKALQVLGGTALDGPKPGVEELIRVSDWIKTNDGDNSVSQFAILGLRAASNWRIMAGAEVWKRNLAVYRERQCDDGGWDYDSKTATGYGSMTCAGICGIAIDRYELGEKDPAADAAIERGLAWLDRNFAVDANPQRNGYLFYYLYSLERVGRILDTEFIGTHEWYPLGARFLVDSQKPTGKWVESGNDAEDPRPPTSFALLFLTRATQTLNPELARNGSGELHTSLSSAPPARLYVILDASGSMLEEMDGRLKFDLARDAASAMFAMLHPPAQAALRVYGHRKRSIEEGANEDTELLIGMQDYEESKFTSTLKGLRARGKTPLALSLTQAADDLRSSREPTTVVLLTDGGEDTMPRRDPIQAAADFGKVPGITFHIIGFDVNQDDWNAQLREMASRAGGQYWAAPKGNDLAHALRAALLGDPEFFTVLDGTGKAVYRGNFGQPHRLPEGKYQLVTQFNNREFRQMFWINTGTITAVTFDAAQAAADQTATAPTTVPGTASSGAIPTEKAGSPLARRFCSHCGKPLLGNAKFCTECGAKVEDQKP